MKRGERTPREKQKEILARYAAGEPLAALAQEHGVQIKTIKSWSRAGHTSRKRAIITPEIKAEIMEKIQAGQSIKSLAREYEISDLTIYKWNSLERKSKMPKVPKIQKFHDVPLVEFNERASTGGQVVVIVMSKSELPSFLKGFYNENR